MLLADEHKIACILLLWGLVSLSWRLTVLSYQNIVENIEKIELDLK